MFDGVLSMSGAGRSRVQAIVTGLLSLALAYRQGQVVFDIPPMRGELLAFIAITLWTAAGVLRVWRSGRDPSGRIEWTLGGGFVGLLLVPHVPMLALVVEVGCAAFAIAQVATHSRRGINLVRTIIFDRPAMSFAVLAMGGFAAGGRGDWLGLGFLVLAAVLVAWQSGRHLWLMSKCRTLIR